MIQRLGGSISGICLDTCAFGTPTETLRLCRLATEVEEGYLGKWLAQPQQLDKTISLYM